jgi:hypothetical protein
MYAHKHPEPTDPRVGPAIVYLIVGLPGAGKTTHAKALETSASALRLRQTSGRSCCLAIKTHQISVTSLKASWSSSACGPRSWAPMSSSILGEGRTISAPLDRWRRRRA